MGDNESLAANMKGLAEQLEHASLSPPASPASTNAEVGDPFKEGKAPHLRVQFREGVASKRQWQWQQQQFTSKESCEIDPHLDRAPTPTLLHFAKRAPESDSGSPGVLEYSAWGPIAEEDTERALKRMAMLARDEHKADPQHSVKEYYSMRLAKLIEEAEVEFDASKLH